jgi:hypothetical protein
MSLDEFAARIKADTVRFRSIVKEAGMQVE